jgi:hypothetical protein
VLLTKGDKASISTSRRIKLRRFVQSLRRDGVVVAAAIIQRMMLVVLGWLSQRSR